MSIRSRLRIDQWNSEAAEDRQWINIDTVRAAAGPYGTTIAHGYLTHSLLPPLMVDLIGIKYASARLNGLNKVHLSPVPAGSRIRGRARIVSVDEVHGGLQVVIQATTEREGGDKPACIAECIVRALA
ncbi:MaoC family dehydratase [Nocardia anaemiae]|uniref:MaoC family dehydratase n=1 Tax=Nocardia anaemiae TaxID=263910 RepID=UPI0007A40ED0|nr:MaoC family dehydratase [Nocardia anaemiae]